MSTSLQRVAPGGIVSSFEEIQSVGQIFAKSGFFSDTRDAAQAVVKIMAGAEMGFGPMASMTGIHIIKGKVGISANLMAQAIKRSGRYDYKVRKLDTEACEIEFFEKGQSVGVSAFTRQEAVKAGTQNLDKFPRNMLFARAMSNGVRWYCPDVTSGPAYTPEELGAVTNEDGDVIGAKPTLRAVPAAQVTVEAETVEAEAMIDDATMGAILKLWPDHGFKKAGVVQPLAPWLKANKGVNALKDLSGEVGAKMLHWLQSRALAAQEAEAQQAEQEPKAEPASGLDQWACGRALAVQVLQATERAEAAGVTEEQWRAELAAFCGDDTSVKVSRKELNADQAEGWAGLLNDWAAANEAKAAAA